MTLIENTLSLETLRQMSAKMSEPMVKAVVDIETNEIVVDAGLHSDEELFLLERGSAQENLWGINLWPDAYETNDFVEFDSMINIRPRQNNRSRGVEDVTIQQKIIQIVKDKIHE